MVTSSVDERNWICPFCRRVCVCITCKRRAAKFVFAPGVSQSPRLEMHADLRCDDREFFSIIERSTVRVPLPLFRGVDESREKVRLVKEIWRSNGVIIPAFTDSVVIPTFSGIVLPSQEDVEK